LKLFLHDESVRRSSDLHLEYSTLLKPAAPVVCPLPKCNLPLRNTLWWELEIICVDITYVTVKNAEVRREQSGHPLSRDMLTMMF
jgi:hypothetical protein